MFQYIQSLTGFCCLPEELVTPRQPSELKVGSVSVFSHPSEYLHVLV